MPSRLFKKITILTLILCLLCQRGYVIAQSDPCDFILEGAYQASVDLPRIWFLFKRDFIGDPLKVDNFFEANWGFLDTGASGIVMSRETRDIMQIDVDPSAEFIDFGVGGAQSFDVSEFLYIGIADYSVSDPWDSSVYNVINNVWRFQMTRAYAEFPQQPLDILGIPVMAGKTVVLDAGSTNYLDPFSASIKEPGDPTIPAVDFQVPLRFERYIHYTDSMNIPPEPILAYNPVIDNVISEHAGTMHQGTWLLDTGAMLSIISVEQGMKFGFTDKNGDPIITPDFWASVSGVGGTIDIPGFTIDTLSIATLSGFNLVYRNVLIAVHDIGVYDEKNDRYIILDGLFGSNFLCATWNADFFNFKSAGTPFDWIVIDMQNGLLGFDVNSIYPLPGVISPVCGDNDHPWFPPDFNRNCAVEFWDFAIFGEEWCHSCDWLNWNCRGADLDFNGEVNLADLAIFTQIWLSKSY